MSDGKGSAMPHDVILPKWGLTMEEGTIIQWDKVVGDTVDEGETIAVIATEKIETDLPAPASGVLMEVLHQEGETVPVGTVIARIGE
jgi:pyruvate/2-oxoglutarate dehydrogenase complex dihydrolipoamide acyltransferase (E2) component